MWRAVTRSVRDVIVARFIPLALRYIFFCEESFRYMPRYFAIVETSDGNIEVVFNHMCLTEGREDCQTYEGLCQGVWIYFGDEGVID